MDASFPTLHLRSQTVALPRLLAAHLHRVGLLAQVLDELQRQRPASALVPVDGRAHEGQVVVRQEPLHHGERDGGGLVDGHEVGVVELVGRGRGQVPASEAAYHGR